MTTLMRAVFAASAVALLLPACGGADDAPAPTSAVPALAEGALQASVQGDGASVGSAFVNAAGQGFVVLSEDGDMGASVMHVIDNTRGRRAPATGGFVTLSFALSQAMSLQGLTGASLAGNYGLMLGGQPTSISVAADGSISAAGSGCQLSGKVDLGATYAGALALSLNLSNCGNQASGAYQGVLFGSAETAPAAWQAVVENGSSVIDFLAYR